MMAYDMGVFSLVTSTSVIAVVVMIFFILSSHVAVGLLPVIGVGGFYAEIDSFEGYDGTVYPELEDGTLSSVGTDTPACEEMPMLVIQLNSAEAQRFDLRKDLKIPYLSNRWMSIRIEQPIGASIEGDELTIYTTQFRADTFSMRNVIIREGGPSGSSTTKWGPNSGEFYIEGGANVENPSVNPGIVAQDVQGWIHAVQGQQITFQSSGSGAIDIDLEYNTNQELEDYYRGDGRLGYDLSSPDSTNVNTDRDEYFQCLPPEF